MSTIIVSSSVLVILSVSLSNYTHFNHLSRTKWPPFLQTFSRHSRVTRFVFWFELSQSLLLRVKLTICQYWFSWWLGAEQASRLCLNQCWPGSLRQIPGGDESIHQCVETPGGVIVFWLAWWLLICWFLLPGPQNTTTILTVWLHLIKSGDLS